MNYIEYLEKMKGYSKNTIDIYSRWANELSRYDNDYKQMLMSLPNYSSSTMRLIISSIISYYKFLKDERYRELELPKKTHKVQAYISFEQYKDYLSKINHKTKKGSQKRLVIRLLFETGIRASELIQIQTKDITKNGIKIQGKGRKERMVKLSSWLQEDLDNYLKDNKSKFLFDFGYKNLYQKVQTLDKERKITPHMFRRGYAKFLHDKGISIWDISLTMGHNSIETTSCYIKKKSDDINISHSFN